MYSQIIKSKLEELPENLEKEILDYIEFLLHKYGNIEPIHSEAEKIKQKRLDIAKELLSEVDDVDDDSQGVFDASADIRRLREERLKQIC
jgi:hypothetical protein